nr:hypothetical protein [Tanacetum cinerariifolium]
KYKEYEKVFVGVDVPTIPPQPVESTQGTNKTPSAHRTPAPVVVVVVVVNDVVDKKKRKHVAGETSSPRKSLKVTTMKKKLSTTPISPPSDDKEWDEIAEATLLNEKSYASEFADSVVLNEEEDSDARLEPGSHKENPEIVNDDEEEEEKKKDDKKDDDNDDDDNDNHTDHTLELTVTVSPTPATTSQDRSKTRRISSKYRHIPGALHRMCKHQGFMIKQMEKIYVTNCEFMNVHERVDKVLYEIIPQIASRATDDLIENNLKRVVADIVIQVRDAFQAEVHALISKEFVDHAPKIIEELIKIYMKNNIIQVHPTTIAFTSTTTSDNHQQQLYLKMKSNLQDQANDAESWDVLKRKFKKSSTLNTYCRDDAFYTQYHNDHPEDDAP